MNPIVTSAGHKKALMEEALKQGLVQVYVDATKPNVKLPEQYMDQRGLLLNLSYRFETVIELREDVLYTVLSFNQTNHVVQLPWESIWLIKDKNGNGLLFPFDAPRDDLPESVIDSTPTKDKTVFEAIEGEGQSSPPKSGHLRLLH